MLADELRGLGITDPASVPGGVAFAAPRAALYLVNLCSRIASRVMLRVADATYHTEEDIYQLARNVKWEDHFTPVQTLRVDLVSRYSITRLAST